MKSWDTGLAGEFRASRFLKKNGFRIIAKRYRAAHGEIDLIAMEGDTLVFIEVKNRPKGGIGEGAFAVNAEKRRHLRLAAQQYLSLHPHNLVRFDVVEFSAAGVRHIRNAF